MVFTLAILLTFCQIVLGEDYCHTKTQKDCSKDTFLVKDGNSCFYSCKEFDVGEDKPGEFFSSHHHWFSNSFHTMFIDSDSVIDEMI